MKDIKIKTLNWWADFDFKTTNMYKVMSKYYNVVFTDNPDYIICSCFGRPYECTKFDDKIVRIMFSGENFIPDFNLVDYSICNYPISFLDRSFYFPICYDEFGHFESLQNKDRNYDKSILNNKTNFCNFIYGHESVGGERKALFEKLCEYKRVESVGSYLNNTGLSVSWDNDSKIDFQSKSKFTITVESYDHDGFITEKITDAFCADTIPIFFGSKTVSDIFNKKAFINCSDYKNFDEVLERVKELDNDDEKYLAMLREPIFNNPKYPEEKMQDFEKFIRNIFDQPLDKAIRRSRCFSEASYNNYLRNAFVPWRAPIGSPFIILFYRIKKILTFPFVFARKILYKLKHKND